MDQAAYTSARDSATGTLIAAWVQYCVQPEADVLAYFGRLQLRLEVAALHAQEFNYPAACAALPAFPTPLTTAASTLA